MSLRGFATVQTPMGRPALQLGAMNGERVSGHNLGTCSDCEVSAQGDFQDLVGGQGDAGE